MKFSLSLTTALVALAASSASAADHKSSILARRGQPGHGQAPFKAVQTTTDTNNAEHVGSNGRMNQGLQMNSNKKPAGAQDPKPAPDWASADGSQPTSDPYYPTPPAQAIGNWKVAVGKAQKLVAQLTTEEKVVLTTGVGWEGGQCVGNIAGIPRVNFPGLCLEDSPLGVRFADLVTVFPTGITTAATFSSQLARDRGVAMGQEHRSKGVNIQLGPGMNMLRSPAAGRNWEMCGADPYLCGEAAYHTIQGVQSQGVQANAKVSPQPTEKVKHD